MDEQLAKSSKSKWRRYLEKISAFLAGALVGVFAGWGVLFLFMMTFNGGLPNLSGGPDYSPIWIGILFGVAVFIGGILLQSKFKGGVVGCLICGVGFGMLAFPGWLGLIFLAWPRGC